MDGVGEALYLETSAPYVGQWNQLISTTNWEKGRIIQAWRDTLIAREAPATEYSDEAWSRLVPGVSSQHVGRLRRVSERFGGVYREFDGVYWSHFHAALDWEDAEMWLEGTVQNGWSVSQMRRTRWEALGQEDETKPRDEDLVAAELDEDSEEPADGPTIEPSIGVVQDPQAAEARAGESAEEDTAAATLEAVPSRTAGADADVAPQGVRPFEDLAPLPDDLAEAMEAFKLAILRHRVARWQEVSADDVLANLDALRALVLAPAEA